MDSVCAWVPSSDRTSMSVDTSNNLLLVQLMRSSCDRVWAFFLPLYIASHVDKSQGANAVSVTAFLYFSRSVCEIVLTPLFSYLWKSWDVTSFIIVENVCLVISAALLVFWSQSSENFVLLFFCAVALSCEASVSEVISSFVKKDSVFRHTRNTSSDPKKIAKANSRLVQIDLFVAALWLLGFMLSCGQGL